MLNECVGYFCCFNAICRLKKTRHQNIGPVHRKNIAQREYSMYAHVCCMNIFAGIVHFPLDLQHAHFAI